MRGREGLAQQGRTLGLHDGLDVIGPFLEPLAFQIDWIALRIPVRDRSREMLKPRPLTSRKTGLSLGVYRAEHGSTWIDTPGGIL